jgi:hypothetical protein
MSLDDSSDVLCSIEGDLLAMADFELFPPGPGTSSAVDEPLLAPLPGQGKLPAPPAPPPPPFFESPPSSDEEGAGGRSPPFATRGDGCNRAVSVPPPTLPYKPPRRRTQEARDMVSIADMLPGLYLPQDGDDKVSDKSGMRRPSIYSMSSYHTQPPSAPSDTLPQTPSWQTPATDHPLSSVEQAELLERVRRDLVGVDVSKIKGPLRELACPSNDHRRSGDVLPVSAFRKDKLNGDTVSPKEAFLDYEDVAARSSPAPSNLFAPLGPSSPPQTHAYAPQHPSHLHSSTRAPPRRSGFDMPKNAVPWSVKEELDSGDDRRNLGESIDFSPSSEEEALIPSRAVPAAQVSLRAPSMIRRPIPNEVFDESYFSRRGSSKVDDTSESSSAESSNGSLMVPSITEPPPLSDGSSKAPAADSVSPTTPTSTAALPYLPAPEESALELPIPSPQDSAERSTFYGDEEDEFTPPLSVDQSSSEEWIPKPTVRTAVRLEKGPKRHHTDGADETVTPKRARKASHEEDDVYEWEDEDDDTVETKKRGPKKKRARRDDSMASPKTHAPGTGNIKYVMRC